MTQPPPPSGSGRSSAAEPPPSASLSPVVRTGAGNPVVLGIGLVNNADQPRLLNVTVVGLDSSWLPLPARVGPVPAGGSVLVELALRPPSGTLPASYPFAVTVQAGDPATGQPSAPTTMVESALLVDEPSRLSMSVHPADVSAVFGRRIEVELRNTGGSPAQVELRSEVSDGAALRLSRHRLQVPPGGSARIRGRLAVTRPRMVGGRSRHPFLIAARGLGAPSSVTGSLTARPLFSPFGTKLLAMIAVLAVWLAVAAVGIGKLAGASRGNQAGTAATSTAAGGGAGKPNPSASGNSGGKAGGKSGGSAGGTGGSGGGSGGAAQGGRQRRPAQRHRHRHRAGRCHGVAAAHLAGGRERRGRPAGRRVGEVDRRPAAHRRQDLQPSCSAAGPSRRSPAGWPPSPPPTAPGPSPASARPATTC